LTGSDPIVSWALEGELSEIHKILATHNGALARLINDAESSNFPVLIKGEPWQRRSDSTPNQLGRCNSRTSPKLPQLEKALRLVSLVSC